MLENDSMALVHLSIIARFIWLTKDKEILYDIKSKALCVSICSCCRNKVGDSFFIQNLTEE